MDLEMIDIEDVDEITVLPILIPQTVLRLLQTHAEQKHTTIGALITQSLRQMVTEEVGGDALTQIERKL